MEICKRGKQRFKGAALNVHHKAEGRKRISVQWVQNMLFLDDEKPCLTKRGNKVFMGTQGLHAALVLVVPNPNGFVISTAHYESSSRVHQHTTHPVVVSHLKKQD